MSGGFDRSLLAVVDAAYRVDDSTEAWLRAILEAAEPALAPDCGVVGATTRLQPDGSVGFSSKLVSTKSVGPGVVDALLTLSNEHTPDYVRAATFEPAPIDTASAAYHRFHPGRDFYDFRELEYLRALGVHDQLAVKGYDPTGVGCMLLGQFGTIIAPPRDKAARWGKVMTHLLSGLRLRTALAPFASEPEAVLEPGGRVVHANAPAKAPTARNALREAALKMDHARTRAGKSDAARALAEWRALVAGRWSLVETFESDGRRYLVARRNDPRLDFPRPLSERERQVAAYAARGYSNKFIAYALGLAPSTVSSHLKAAMRRLGARNAGELAAILSLGNDEK